MVHVTLFWAGAQAPARNIEIPGSTPCVDPE
jgi:hypothetical protein